MEAIGRDLAVVAGLAVALAVLFGAIRTVVVPRGDPVLLTRALFLCTRRIVDLRLRRVDDFERRDRVLAYYAPFTLVLLPGVWVALVIAGFTAVFWGLGIDPLERALDLSGSSMLTLGFVGPDPGVSTYGATFVEATLGLGLVALLISYLPTIYGAFQRRELLVARLVTRAGEPPSAITMIIRHQRLQRLDALDETWDDFETWFADIEETHTSQPSIVFFRSISHERSWITAAGVVLDCAALRASTLDLEREPRAELCLRAGYLSLRRIARYFNIPFDPDPRPDAPISIREEEFVEAYQQLVDAGVPVRADARQCWLDYAGWRVNYDAPLVGLCGLVEAPPAPWGSDRAVRPRSPRLRRAHR
jgi:hypothetical protein